jgi:hypothetical protein
MHFKAAAHLCVLWGIQGPVCGSITYLHVFQQLLMLLLLLLL